MPCLAFLTFAIPWVTLVEFVYTEQVSKIMPSLLYRNLPPIAPKCAMKCDKTPMYYHTALICIMQVSLYGKDRHLPNVTLIRVLLRPIEVGRLDLRIGHYLVPHYRYIQWYFMTTSQYIGNECFSPVDAYISDVCSS